MGAIQNTTAATSADIVMVVGLGAVGMGALMVNFLPVSPACHQAAEGQTNFRLDSKNSKLQGNHSS